MQLQPLTAISPIDGRYRTKTETLADYFSEFALMRYRLRVEVEYFIFLGEKKIFKLPLKLSTALRKLYKQFDVAQAEEIKRIEKTTNHDVKALEYYIKQKLEMLQAAHLSEWVHFGLTSQDVNNTAIPLSIKEYIEFEYLPSILNVVSVLKQQAQSWKKISMLAKTHGQPASPTILGKEWMVFVERINNQIQQLSTIPYMAKFGGATGNFNAHVVAFPKKNWVELGNEFVEKKLGLTRCFFTTQIEHYDMLAALMDAVKRINTICIDFCRDVWTYISMEYFTQKTKANEVGSSAMPHKVNPIDFENAEGNLGVSNALLEFMSAKLPISRLQRDLTDSTVLRNIGVPFAHTSIAFASMQVGLQKLQLQPQTLHNDLDENWVVVSEAIQTILRREQYDKPYEALKALTRGNKKINQQILHQFIDTLSVKSAVKKELKAITPFNYTGVTPSF